MFKPNTIFLLLTFACAHAQNANCDYKQNVTVGQSYYVYSPNYSNNYTAGVQCRWVATCPTGYNCRLECSDIALPASSSCSVDRLLISKSGDLQLSSADYYCGRGSLTAVSTAQTISVGLKTSTSSPGGRFLCTLTAQAASTDTSCSCGYKKTNRIVGGQETGVNEYPMMAAIVLKSTDGVWCGAVIIQSTYVLTAAHCVVNRDATTVGVVVGEHNTATGSETTAMKGYAVQNITIHPQFNSKTFDYDIAVVTIKGQFTFSERVGPVCLPFKFANTDLTGTKVTLLGWGTQMSGGAKSDVLQEVDVDVISQASCRSQVPTLTPQQLCTYTPGKDSCQNDSGGPGLRTDPATGLLFNVGIVSYGRYCASTDPGVNTRVTTLLDWIVANAPANYCRK